jgi:hypothetical protein
MIKQIFGALAGLAVAMPSWATSWTDINTLEKLVANTGTNIQAINCPGKEQGSYRYDKEAGIDLLIVCANNVDMTDPDAVWEVLVHEATHVMQACYGGPVIKDTYIPRILRQLQTTAPHYYAILNQYRGDHKRVEIEAFWMELQTPATAFDWFKDYCYKSPEASA